MATKVEVLRLAEIPPARQGRARVSRLSDEERRLYLWILRELAAGVVPTAQALAAAAAGFSIDLADALVVLAREDLVHTDAAGSPVVAYPFSAERRGHQVRVNASHTVQAMCAIDALGIAAMLGLPIVIVSRDPQSGGEVRIEVDPASGAGWQPDEAVVLAGSACCDGPSFRGCCDVLNFFERTADAERYLAEHREIAGSPVSIPEAIEAGRVLFGDVFKEG